MTSPVRCAIYTRKSSDAGIANSLYKQTEFNSDFVRTPIFTPNFLDCFRFASRLFRGE
jgi:hypothetical protein